MQNIRNIKRSQITCIWKKVHLNNAYWQSINTKNDLLIELSGEIKTLIDKSMLEIYRKYKCCVFIDFEYKTVHRNTYTYYP